MKYKFVLFDADNTLFDYDLAEMTSFQKTLNYFKILENFEQFYESYKIVNHQIWQEFEDGLISSKKLRVERFIRFAKQENLKIDAVKMSQKYIEFLGECTFLLDGALEISEYLSDKCELALITNGIADVQNRRFAKSELAKFYQHRFISDEIGFQKPDKGIFEFVFSKLKCVDKKSAIIIGDNRNSDIKGGNDFGIDTCWYNIRKCEKNEIIPTFEISKLSELKNILEEK
ncbi:MAG: noncanonical pyrimidine nucleotidase, YjjG family [Candidatus Cloacimonetes bacterium]|nr:noncanonical pyrimidine nucleotidase, YjjG family [Candidatus Cloacimonadota bacterium]MBT7469680.1 noncanonical pyrimidine nucleotidase, YjjG family [Candidatus Cloacimonadota bacterium]